MASTSPIKISHNCKQVLFNIPMSGVNPGEYTLAVESNSTSSTFPVTLAPGQGVIVFNTDLETSGVVVATVTDSNGLTVTQMATVSTCKIDCCIAKLTDDAIKCSCNCNQCHEDLMRAEKIFLLLQSAVYAAEVAGNIQDAKAKYDKANELCTEVCACGC